MCLKCADLVDLRLGNDRGCAFGDFVLAAKWILIAQAGKIRMEVGMPLALPLDARCCTFQETLRVFNGFAVSDDRYPDGIAYRCLKRAGFEQAEPRVSVLVLVSELQERLSVLLSDTLTTSVEAFFFEAS